HRANGAKMAPFAGFDMPVQYSSILVEHEHTRTRVGIFDICHMGEFLLKGNGAKEALNTIVSHDLDTLAAGKCRYGFLLNQSGGIVDDMIVYCLAREAETTAYMIVVNGACEEKDFTHIASQLPSSLALENISSKTGKIDVQGPQSLAVLNDVLGSSWNHLKYFNFEETSHNGHSLIVSRTGYTGELGYELYLPEDKTLDMWEKLMADERVAPVGLGARDTLRLECGYPLYGQDLDDKHNPVEAGYGWLMKKEIAYTGKAGLDVQREILVPLTIAGRRSARHDDLVLDASGSEIGRVTSGSFSPTLGHCLALAYIRADTAEKQSYIVKGARAELEAKKGELPFYKEGTARKKVE
ncbi:MAG: glycine cleavage system aminomethyltransferase GcvT, partial [Proteobacteria bacterium]|nr:glycine cleavage system aminomethyltransferase GcvT [Pseudomonadota bacterium]